MILMFKVQFHGFVQDFQTQILLSDALQLSIPAQGLANGDAALPHAAYPGIQPYPGVGEFKMPFFQLSTCYVITLCLAS